MTPVIMVCSEHGNLTIDQVNKNGKKFRCKKCHSAQKKAHYERNKAKVLAKQAAWRKENPEKVKEVKRISDAKNRHKHVDRKRITNRAARARNPERYRERDREKKQRYRDELHPVYVRDKISRGTGLSASEIPHTLVEFKTQIMKIKKTIRGRVIKKRKNTERAIHNLETLNE